MRVAFEQAAAEVAGRPINATVSIGAAWTIDNVSADLVLADADAALYRAKAAGRNRVMLAEEPALSPDSGHDLPAAAPVNRGDRRTRWSIGLEVVPERRRMLEGRRLHRAVVGLAGLPDRNEQRSRRRA